MVTGEVEVDLTAFKMVTKLIVRKDKTSTVNVDQFSLAYIVDAEILVYTDYPNISPVQTVSCMIYWEGPNYRLFVDSFSVYLEKDF